MTILTDEMIENAFNAWANVPKGSERDFIRAALEAILPDIVEACSKVGRIAGLKEALKLVKARRKEYANGVNDWCHGAYSAQGEIADDIRGRIAELERPS